MQSHSQQLLGYSTIIERLAEQCAFSASRELARGLQPSDDFSIVSHRLALTTEARRLLDDHPDIGVQAARDIRPAVRMAERGAMLSPEQLLEVRMTLRSSVLLNHALTTLDDSFPLLWRLGGDLPVRTTLDNRIEACITDEGSVRDGASPLLSETRGQIRLAQQRLQERLNGLVNEFRGALQEHLITMRDGRYVLPVKSEARDKVRGIVHDQSASGATVFVEPTVIIEMNNLLRELELNERREVECILQELSGEVAKDAPYCILAVELLAEIDLQFAKARYSQATKGNPPQLNERGIVKLVEARHPLLTGTVVPLNFQLGDAFSMVVITGPNTGGKTVALKTVGLLALMTAAGLHIPADERSQMPIFRGVFADIGDEQSIEQSLSTFSSHMTRIIEILQQAGSGTLVLLDELGAGTDPREGSALARAIVREFMQRKVVGMVTTHLTDLVTFAQQNDGLETAAMGYDPETLLPNYIVHVGVVGSSCALAIARQLGMPESLIDDANALLQR